VKRRLGYHHHGIYVRDDRVIQFGGGVRDKPGATIEAVSLDDFEREGQAEVVLHDGIHTDRGVWLPAADPPERIVERAEWLLANHPPRGRYHLIGNNCEHMANFCVSEFTESPQVRHFFMAKACATALLGWWIAWARRNGKRLPTAPILIATLGSVAITATYDLGIRRFWRDVGKRWRADDRERRKATGT
jgi:hypothetical protein